MYFLSFSFSVRCDNQYVKKFPPKDPPKAPISAPTKVTKFDSSTNNACPYENYIKYCLSFDNHICKYIIMSNMVHKPLLQCVHGFKY